MNAIAITISVLSTALSILWLVKSKDYYEPLLAVLGNIAILVTFLRPESEESLTATKPSEKKHHAKYIAIIAITLFIIMLSLTRIFLTSKIGIRGNGNMNNKIIIQ